MCAPKPARNILAAQPVALVALKIIGPLGKTGFAQSAEKSLEIPAVAKIGKIQPVDFDVKARVQTQRFGYLGASFVHAAGGGIGRGEQDMDIVHAGCVGAGLLKCLDGARHDPPCRSNTSPATCLSVAERLGSSRCAVSIGGRRLGMLTGGRSARSPRRYARRHCWARVPRRAAPKRSPDRIDRRPPEEPPALHRAGTERGLSSSARPAIS